MGSTNAIFGSSSIRQRGELSSFLQQPEAETIENRLGATTLASWPFLLKAIHQKLFRRRPLAELIDRLTCSLLQFRPTSAAASRPIDAQF